MFHIALEDLYQDFDLITMDNEDWILQHFSLKMMLQESERNNLKSLRDSLILKSLL